MGSRAVVERDSHLAWKHAQHHDARGETDWRTKPSHDASDATALPARTARKGLEFEQVCERRPRAACAGRRASNLIQARGTHRSLRSLLQAPRTVRIVLGVRQRGGHRLEPAGIVQFGVLFTAAKGGAFPPSRQVSRTDGGLGRGARLVLHGYLSVQTTRRGVDIVGRFLPRATRRRERQRQPSVDVESTNHHVLLTRHQAQHARVQTPARPRRSNVSL